MNKDKQEQKQPHSLGAALMAVVAANPAPAPCLVAADYTERDEHLKQALNNLRRAHAEELSYKAARTSAVCDLVEAFEVGFKASRGATITPDAEHARYEWETSAKVAAVDALSGTTPDAERGTEAFQHRNTVQAYISRALRESAALKAIDYKAAKSQTPEAVIKRGKKVTQPDTPKKGVEEEVVGVTFSTENVVQNLGVVISRVESQMMPCLPLPLREPVHQKLAAFLADVRGMYASWRREETERAAARDEEIKTLSLAVGSASPKRGKKH